jgi:hypothetical protein
LTIPASAIPAQYKKDDKQAINLTGIAVAPNGDIYVTDGYGLDFIHRFDKAANISPPLAARGAVEFRSVPQDRDRPRFKPVRLICTDRRHDRLVHMDLDGHCAGRIRLGIASAQRPGDPRRRTGGGRADGAGFPFGPETGASLRSSAPMTMSMKSAPTRRRRKSGSRIGFMRRTASPMTRRATAGLGIQPVWAHLARRTLASSGADRK